MPIALLGPVRVGENGSQVSPRDRAVLVALALRPGTVVSPEGLADALWDGAVPPKTWTKIVQGSVMRLRRVLGAGSIETTSAGYRLVVDEDEFDLRTFERLIARASSLAELGEHERAVITLDQALSLWRGKPFGDLNDWPPARAEAVRLDELRQAAEESRLRSLLTTSAPEALVGQARALVSLQPLREHRWALLARTLYASGRQGEALACIQQTKRVMRDELGLDASPQITNLEAAILRQDPELVAKGDYPPAGLEAICPYRGLRPFSAADAEWFFGRDAETEACLARLADAQLVLVVGPSGSGKSSLLRAGVVARLDARGRRCVVITPGSDPLASLTSACADLSDSGILVVDQLEEIFVAQAGAQAAGFLQTLAGHVGTGITAVAAMRGDHVIDLGTSSDFAHLAERGLHIVTSLDEAGLQAAIEGPAHQAGLRLEPGLVELLIRDTLGEPGGLPLLSHALVETWERREGRTLTVEGYRAAGGIRGAVAQSAERLYAALPQDERDTVRAMLLRLVAPTPDGEPTSTRVAMSVMRRDTEHERLLDLLVGARLVTTDEQTVTIAHESLGRAWPRLRGWLDDDLEGQRLLRHLASAAVEWDAAGQPASELYRGARLQSVREWSQREQPDLTAVESGFISASQAAADEDERATVARLHRERRQNKKLRWLLVGTAGALVLALVSGVLAWTQQRQASQSALEADARRLGALAATEQALDRALLLAVQGVRLHDDADTVRNLLDAATRTPEAERVLHSEGRRLYDVTVSPDTRYVAMGDHLGAVTIRDLRSGEPVFEHQQPGDVPLFEGGHLLSFSPDSRHLLVGFSGLYLLTLEDGTVQVETLVQHDSRIVDGDGDARFTDALWPGDGSTVTVLHGRDGVSSWDVATAQKLGQGQPWAEERPGAKLIDQDTVVLHSNSGSSAIADAMTGSLRHTIDRATWPYAVSPDRTRLVGRDRDEPGGLVIVDAKTGGLLRSAQPQSAYVTSIAFAPDGQSIATGSWDRFVTILDGGTLAVRDRLVGHGGDILGVCFQSADKVWSVARDGRAILWDVGSTDSATSTVARTVTSDLGPTPSGRVSPDGRFVGYSTNNGGLRVYDVDRQAQVLDLPAVLSMEAVAEGAVDSDFSADARVFAALDGHGNAQVVDVAGKREYPPIRVEEPGSEAIGSEAIALSNDASRAVIGTRQGISVWDTESGSRLLAERTPAWVKDVEFDASSQWIIVATLDSTVTVFDAATLQPVETLHVDGMPFVLALSSDNQTLAVSTEDSTVRFYDTGTWREFDQVAVDEHVGFMTWDHSGERFVSVGVSGELIVWYGRDHTQIARTSLDKGDLGYAGFTTDDSTMVTLTRYGRVVEWTLSTASAIDHACAVAGRDLTRTEWKQFLPDRPYERTCSAP